MSGTAKRLAYARRAGRPCKTNRIADRTCGDAWLKAQPGVTAPIASATTTLQLGEPFEATRLNLDPDQPERLDNASRQ